MVFSRQVDQTPDIWKSNIPPSTLDWHMPPCSCDKHIICGMGPGESQCWSLEDGTWSTFHDLVGDRYGSSFCLVPDKLVVLGGGWWLWWWLNWHQIDGQETFCLSCYYQMDWWCSDGTCNDGIWYLATVSWEHRIYVYVFSRQSEPYKRYWTTRQADTAMTGEQHLSY